MTNYKKKDVRFSYNPLAEVRNHARFNDFFNDMFSLVDHMWNERDLTGDAFYALQSNKSSLPKINVAETDDAYEVQIAVAGYNKDDLSLEFKDACLFIKTEKKVEKEDSEDRKWLTREISTRSSRRAIKFPIKINSSGIVSAFDEDKSLVTCTLPKVKKTEPEVVKIKID